ncbi:MAG: hypothetical protein WCP98_10120 [Actinomycetes bacterium]
MNQQGNDTNDELQPEYDFSAGTRGKHHASYQAATNVVLLDPDVAEFFHDSASVNQALRVLARIALEQTHSSRSA